MLKIVMVGVSSILAGATKEKGCGFTFTAQRAAGAIGPGASRDVMMTLQPHAD